MTELTIAPLPDKRKAKRTRRLEKYFNDMADQGERDRYVDRVVTLKPGTRIYKAPPHAEEPAYPNFMTVTNRGDLEGKFFALLSKEDFDKLVNDDNQSITLQKHPQAFVRIIPFIEDIAYRHITSEGETVETFKSHVDGDTFFVPLNRHAIGYPQELPGGVRRYLHPLSQL